VIASRGAPLGAHGGGHIVSETIEGRTLRSTVTDSGELILSIEPIEVAPPGAGEVVIEVGAAPVNPSDLRVLLGGGDIERAVAQDGSVRIPLGPRAVAAAAARIGRPMTAGNEGAGIVVATGDSPAAAALAGRTVATLAGGGMYGTHVTVPADRCLPVADGTDPRDAASAFVNPLTALGMVDTMRLEGHTAIVHTAAASNLGQMLNRLCIADGVPLVAIVRKPEHVELLRAQGATHVIDSSADSFEGDLTDAIRTAGATIAFDAIAGGTLASSILRCMEAAQSPGDFSAYGSSTHKQVYIYGGLDPSPTVLDRNYGFAWSIGGWLLTPFLARVGAQRAGELRARVAAELTTTFASNYGEVIGLDDMLDIDHLRGIARMATGAKALVAPGATTQRS
jgi:NADPH:quinone reductase